MIDSRPRLMQRCGKLTEETELKNFRLFSALLGLLFLSAAQWRAKAGPITGIYRITPRGQQSMALDVNNFANANGTKVQIWNSTKNTNQQWFVEKQSDNTYKIYAYSGKNSLQMLDYAGGAITNGTAVTTWEDAGSNNQLWYFLPLGNGFYRIIPKNASITSGQTLEIVGGNNAGLNAATDIYTFYGGLNQQFRLDYAGPTKILGNPKKGVGGREMQTVAMHCAWYYTWGGDRPNPAPSSVEFVPMEWGYYGNANNGSINWLNSRKAQPGVKAFLGFNEPDHTDQANLSVNYALEGFSYMSTLGIPIGSPACADDNDSWMQSFMSKANGTDPITKKPYINPTTKLGYRIDFVCVHCYSRNPYDFIGYIQYIHNLYGKPLWITEFAPADWSGTNPVSAQECMNYMRIAVPWLNSQDYVQRYAWYTGSAPGGTWTLSSAGLVNNDGSLSAMGQLYSRM